MNDECQMCGAETVSRSNGRYCYQHCPDCGHVEFDDLEGLDTLYGGEGELTVNDQRATAATPFFNHYGFESPNARQRWSRQP